MEIYHSEEQQIETLKKWWRENGPSVLFGAVVGLGGLFGWNAWQDYQVRHATEASVLYSELMLKMETDPQGFVNAYENLRAEYRDTVYAPLAALAAAKVAVDQNNIDAAFGHLQWAIYNAEQPEIEAVARLRMARLHLVQGQFDKVEGYLNDRYPQAYAAAVDELRGDLHLAKGRIDIARQSYERALQAEVASQNRQMIQIKLDQLAPSTIHPGHKDA